jgi:hypothetical protein
MHVDFSESQGIITTMDSETREVRVGSSSNRTSKTCRGYPPIWRQQRHWKHFNQDECDSDRISQSHTFVGLTTCTLSYSSQWNRPTLHERSAPSGPHQIGEVQADRVLSTELVGPTDRLPSHMSR